MICCSYRFTVTAIDVKSFKNLHGAKIMMSGIYMHEPVSTRSFVCIDRETHSLVKIVNITNWSK